MMNHLILWRIWKKDGVTNYAAAPESSLFGDYEGDKYDDKGYLKQEVKDAAIGFITDGLSPKNNQLNNGGAVMETEVIENKLKEYDGWNGVMNLHINRAEYQTETGDRKAFYLIKDYFGEKPVTLDRFDDFNKIGG